MIHTLRSEKVLLIEPQLWEAKCKMLDELDPIARIRPQVDTAKIPAGAVIAGELQPVTIKADSGFETDIYGEPLPRPEITADGTAVIPIKGVLAGDCPALYEIIGVLNTFTIAQWISEATANPVVKRVVLDVDCPGGSTMGIAELADSVRSLQDEYDKPIICFSRGTVGSAAYWITSACYALFGTPSSVWGSIGAYRVHVNQVKQFDMMGLTVQIFRSGKLKGMGEPGTDLTPEQRNFLQSQVEANGERFRAAVEARRPIPREQMEGQFYSAPEAAPLGFVDYVVPNIQAALDELR